MGTAHGNDKSSIQIVSKPHKILKLRENAEEWPSCEALLEAMTNRIQAIQGRKSGTDEKKQLEIDEVLWAYQTLKDPADYEAWKSEQAEKLSLAEREQWDRKGRMPRGAGPILKLIKQVGKSDKATNPYTPTPEERLQAYQQKVLNPHPFQSNYEVPDVDESPTGWDLAKLATANKLQNQPRFLAELLLLIEDPHKDVAFLAAYTLAALKISSPELQRRLIELLSKEQKDLGRPIWFAMEESVLRDPEHALDLLHLSMIPNHPNWHIARNLLKKLVIEDIEADKWKPFFGALVRYLYLKETRDKARELLLRADFPAYVLETLVANVPPELQTGDVHDLLWYERYIRTLVSEQERLKRFVPSWIRL